MDEPIMNLLIIPNRFKNKSESKIFSRALDEPTMNLLTNLYLKKAYEE